MSGVGILLADKLIEVVRVWDRSVKLRLALDYTTVTSTSAQGPQVDELKEHFYEFLLKITLMVEDKNVDFNGFHRVDVSYSFGSRNEKGTRLL